MNVGLVGIPVETLRLTLDDSLLSLKDVYMPGITDPTRKAVISQIGIPIEDFGEVLPVVPRNNYKPSRFNHLDGVPVFFEDQYMQYELDVLLAEKQRVMNKGLDLLVALGPSHLGGLFLYEAGDNVARFDYHSDFLGLPPRRVLYSYASYMDWVAHNLPDITVRNYCVKEGTSSDWERGDIPKVFGEHAALPDDFTGVNHFDIDVDFSADYTMHRWPHDSGPTNTKPEDVLRAISQAKPRKIGIFEHRPECRGVEFIADAIRAAAGMSTRFYQFEKQIM